MDNTEIAVRLEAHEHEIGSLKHRVKELEAESRALQKLTVCVNKMAVNMENMIRELAKHGERLEAMEREPAETHKQVKQAVMTSVVGTAVGAVVTAVLMLL